MKNKLKLSTLFLSLLLVIQMGSISYAEEIPMTTENKVFTDISGIEEEAFIIDLYNKGYINGMGNQLFMPNETISMSQMIQLFVNFMELKLDDIGFIKELKATDYYVNAKNDAWYAKSMVIAAANGLIFSKDIEPDTFLTKEVFIDYLVNNTESQYGLPMINIIPKEIEDQDEMNVIYSGAIQRALVYGWVELDMGGKVNPTALVTRAEAMSMVYKAIEYLAAYDYIGELPSITGKLSGIDEGTAYHMNFELLNNTEEDIRITYSSGQKYDILIYNASEELVYNWSNDKGFTMALVDVMIEKGSTISFDESWNYIDNNGHEVGEGIYKIVFRSSFRYNNDRTIIEDTIMVTVK